MKETSKYCEECYSKFTPASLKTDTEKEFYRAHTSSTGILPTDYQRGPNTTTGICDKCGKDAVLYFYRLPK